MDKPHKFYFYWHTVSGVCYNLADSYNGGEVTVYIRQF